MNVSYVYDQVLHVMVGVGTLRNTPMNERRYTAYIGVDNTIDLQFKDRDRKPVDITLKTVIWQMTDPITGEALIRKTAFASDAAKGQAKLQLLDHDTMGISAGIYHVGIMLVATDGTTSASYTDLNYDARAEIELRTGAYEAFRSSDQTVSFSDPFTATGYSGPLKAAGQVSDVCILNTVAVYMTNYVGTIYIESSLEEVPVNWNLLGDPAGYSYTDYTGIDTFNINSRAKWLRIKYIPDITNTGTIDKVICRA